MCDVVELLPPIYPPADGVSVERDHDHAIRLVARARDSLREQDFADEIVGALPIVGRDPETGLLVTRFLCSQPAVPFTPASVAVMWDAVQRLPGPVAASVRFQGYGLGGGAAELGSGLALPSLSALLAHCAHLVCRWPSREDVLRIWRHVGDTGGREDAIETGRRWRGDGAVSGVGHPVPAMTARIVGDEAPWKLAALATVAGAVRARILAKYPDEWAAVSLLDDLERLASPGHARPDPPPSVWPGSLRSAHRLGLEVLADWDAAVTGEAWAPMCFLWQMYEAWVSYAVLNALEAVLGAPTDEPRIVSTVGGAPCWRSGWALPDREVWLWSQPEFGRERLLTVPGAVGSALVSVTAKLRPDVFVSVSDGNGLSHWAFDAKQRGGRMLTAGQVSEAAAKYVWGIRHPGKLDETVLAGCRVLATNGGAGMIDVARARIGAARVLPGHETDVLPAALRERLASS